VPRLVARGRGGVINVSSIGAFQAVPFMAAYGASKAFVLSFSEALARELGPSGVRVLCVCPGPTETEFNSVAGLPSVFSRVPHKMSPERVAERTLRALDRGRVVKVPGLINFLGAFFTRFTPRPLLRWLVGALFRPRAPKPLPPPSVQS
jgi:short-subunit dehydrogenase